MPGSPSRTLLPRRPTARLLLCASACLAAACGGAPAPGPWLTGARILVPGVGVANQQCRPAICPHNENTDLFAFKGAIYFVHRTALSQILGPNSSLHVYRSTDAGQTFTEVATVLAPDQGAAPPEGRDLRDPELFELGGQLFIKALTRLPVNSTRDSNVASQTVITRSTDGATWTPLQTVGETGYSLWRPKVRGGVVYSAAYQDGDQSVWLFTSPDGVTWTRGAQIYGVAADTPLETELDWLGGGQGETMLALVRMDGTDLELLGTTGRLRTKVCTAQPPYTSFDCSAEISGQRLDGPVSFWWQGRLFVVARKHIQTGKGQKRTALFELTGLTPGSATPPKIIEWGELPSAGDTAYAGVVPLAGTRDAPQGSRFLVTWYSSELARDQHWALAMFQPSDIWRAEVDLALLANPN